MASEGIKYVQHKHFKVAYNCTKYVQIVCHIVYRSSFAIIMRRDYILILAFFSQLQDITQLWLFDLVTDITQLQMLYLVNE